MIRSRQVFLVMAVLVLCAGVVVGRLSARLSSELPPPPPGHPPSWLADQLSLSADQRQQMDAIWADVKQQQGADRDKRHDLDQQRDEAIRDLLNHEQWLAYQDIYEAYHIDRQELEKAWDNRIKAAEEKSRALLSDSQKARWDQMAKDMHGHRPPHSGFGPTSQWAGDHEHGDHGPGDHGPGDHVSGEHGPDSHPGSPDSGPDADTEIHH